MAYSMVLLPQSSKLETKLKLSLGDRLWNSNDCCPGPVAPWLEGMTKRATAASTVAQCGGLWPVLELGGREGAGRPERRAAVFGVVQGVSFQCRLTARSGQTYRFLGFWDKGALIIPPHGISKMRPKTPDQEIKIAKKCKGDWKGKWIYQMVESLCWGPRALMRISSFCKDSRIASNCGSSWKNIGLIDW
jgi:hypothetical protein